VFSPKINVKRGVSWGGRGSVYEEKEGKKEGR